MKQTRQETDNGQQRDEPPIEQRIRILEEL